jgi:hypothetical protein
VAPGMGGRLATTTTWRRQQKKCLQMPLVAKSVARPANAAAAKSARAHQARSNAARSLAHSPATQTDHAHLGRLAIAADVGHCCFCCCCCCCCNRRFRRCFRRRPASGSVCLRQQQASGPDRMGRRSAGGAREGGPAPAAHQRRRPRMAPAAPHVLRITQMRPIERVSCGLAAAAAARPAATINGELPIANGRQRGI